MEGDNRSLVHATRLGFAPEFARTLADSLVDYLSRSFGREFFVEAGTIDPALGSSEVLVVVSGALANPALGIMKAAAQHYAGGFRAGWIAKGGTDSDVIVESLRKPALDD